MYTLDASIASGSGGAGFLATFLPICIIFLFCLPIIIYRYAFTAIALQKVALRRNISNPWLAWVPIADLWLLGQITSDYELRNGKDVNWSRRLLTHYFLYLGTYILANITCTIMIFHTELYSLGLLAFIFVSITFCVATVSYYVYFYICIYKFFKSTAGELAWLFLLLAIFVPISLPICLFVFRNKGYEVNDENIIINI